MSSDTARVTVHGPPTLKELRAHRSDILRLADKYGVSNIRVFGSVVRGDATADSDIDLLVNFRVRESGLDLIAFAQDLEELLGRSVDVGTSVHEAVRSRVEEQSVPL